MVLAVYGYCYAGDSKMSFQDDIVPTIFCLFFIAGCFLYLWVIHVEARSKIENKKFLVEEKARKEAADRQFWAAQNEHVRRQTEIDQLAKHKADQKDYYKQMITSGEHSIEVFESMPGYLSDAEKYLDQAEIDFADNALSPFWNCIEETATKLASFNKGTQNIKDDLSHYTGLIEKYEESPPQFPLTSQSVSKLGVGTATSERMQAIVRKAQCNFQFATIYEQRKTNQLLVTGFTNLAQALDRMTIQLNESITDLTVSLNQSTFEILSEMDGMEYNNSRRHQELLVRQNETMEEFDNIQSRHRIGNVPLMVSYYSKSNH